MLLPNTVANAIADAVAFDVAAVANSDACTDADIDADSDAAAAQGYINRGTCSQPELTSCHVLPSAYVIIF